MTKTWLAVALGVFLVGCGCSHESSQKRLFSHGDVVKFKTNSNVEMVVIRYHHHSNWVTCSWMDAKQIRKQDIFYEAELTAVR